MFKVRFALILVAFLLLGGCQQEVNLDSEALAHKLLAEVISEEMLEIRSDRIGNFYPGLNDALAGGMISASRVYLCAEAVLADEIAIFQAKDARSATQVKTALNAHYQVRIAIYADYAPYEAERIKKRAFVEQGRWLVTVICDEPTRATEIIKAAFK